MLKERGERLKSKLDLDLIVFDGDRDLRHALLADKRFKRIAKELGAPALISQRRGLLLSALRLSPDVTPEVFNALGRVSETLGTNLPIELYCVADRDINAFVMPPERGRVLLGLTSQAIEGLDEGELCFVLGHELGHALYDHFALSPEHFLDHDEIAPLHIAQLCAWKRYAELTADRVGLLCCDDFDSAVRAFFKLTSGLSGARFMHHAERSAEQIAALDGDALESTEHDWFATHPYSPLRVRALDLFSKSETYHRLRGRNSTEAGFHSLLGKSGKALSETDLEREVTRIMAVMDPSFLDQGDHSDDMREFLALSGVAVATADGRFERVEEKLLGSLVGRRGVLRDAKKLLNLSLEEHQKRLAELGARLTMMLSGSERRKLVEDLVAVALADHVLEQREVDVIADCADLICVEPTFVFQALERAHQSLD